MGNQSILGVIFDLDGVIVSTDECHYQAWKRMSDEEGLPFDRTVNERLRGVSRMESLSIILERSTKAYSPAEKEEMATRKNAYYVDLIGKLTADDILPGTTETLKCLREKGIRIAIGSSSRNAPLILKQIKLNEEFDVIVDGNQIKQSKPNPEVFLLAAKLLQLSPEQCLVVEDADAGIEAAEAAGMRSLGVGSAAQNEAAKYHAESLAGVDILKILAE